MAPVVNGRVLFNEIPQGYPEPGKTVVYDTSDTIDPDTVPLKGGFLVKTLEVSVDPYMRGRMRDEKVESYAPAFKKGKPIDGYAIGKVIRSENPQVKVGDHVYGYLEFQNYSVRKDLTGLRIIENKEKLPWSLYVGVLGMPGKTAYMAWKEYAQAKKGETVFVSAAAGPVGSFVIQLAKMDGLKTIGTAGSDEKVEFLKEIGTDVVFNYKTTKPRDVLLKEGGIDIYWDNVGGETLDNALEASKVNARFIECGMISGYNTGFNTPLPNIIQIVARSIKLYGFIVFRIEHMYNDEFYKVVPPLVASGKIKYKEDVTNGLDKVGDVILAVQKGLNKGKAVVHVADD